MNVINFYIYSQKNVVSVVFFFLVFDPSVEPSKKICLMGEFWNFLISSIQQPSIAYKKAQIFAYMSVKAQGMWGLQKPQPFLDGSPSFLELQAKLLIIKQAYRTYIIFSGSYFTYSSFICRNFCCAKRMQTAEKHKQRRGSFMNVLQIRYICFTLPSR